MLVLGITGGTGSGKSTVCSYLEKKGAYIIDADLVAREIVEKGRPALCEIKEAFGEDILFEDGSLDRKKLGRIVFASAQKLNILNEITHKYIIAEIKKRAQKEVARIAVIDAALLFETELYKLCNKTIAVTADKEERKSRIVRRDSLEEETAKNRIASQMENSYYEKNADFIIVNDGTLDELKLKIDKILKELL